MRHLFRALVLLLPLLAAACKDVPADYDYGRVENFGGTPGTANRSGFGS